MPNSYLYCTDVWHYMELRQAEGCQSACRIVPTMRSADNVETLSALQKKRFLRDHFPGLIAFSLPRRFDYAKVCCVYPFVCVSKL